MGKVTLTVPSLGPSLLKLCRLEHLLRYGIAVSPEPHLAFLLQTRHVQKPSSSHSTRRSGAGISEIFNSTNLFLAL